MLICQVIAGTHCQCKPMTCNEHRALKDRSKIHKGCDVTGIGSIACMRHGAFVPGAQVDFQKGER